MNRDETRNAFVKEQMHPNCPRCGNGVLKFLKKLIMREDGNPWRLYLCNTCGERFTATVETR